MLGKIIQRIEYTCIIFLLIIGLLVSFIGVTWCRYQTTTQKQLTFKVKGAGEYYVNDQTQWVFDYSTSLHSMSFSVSNTLDTKIVPEGTSRFHVRLTMNENVTTYLYVSDLSGKETKYKSKLYRSDNATYEYGYVDIYGNELKHELQGNKASTQYIRLEVEGTTNAFISEVSIIDASYDVEKHQLYTVSPSIPLEVTSNYLSDVYNYTVLTKDSVDITFKSNYEINSTISIESSSANIDASINNSQKLDIKLLPDTTHTVKLDVKTSSSQDEYVNVVMKLYNENQVIKTYKAKFLVKASLPLTSRPTVTLSYVNNQNTFDKYTPLQFNITSNIDANVQIKEDLFPVGTKYSLDLGQSWYVLSKSQEIDLELKKNSTQNVIIDFIDTNMKWENKSFNIFTYHNGYNISSLNFQKKANTLVLLEASTQNLGVVSKNAGAAFTTNTNDFSITLEQYKNNTYTTINKDTYLTWVVSNDNKTYEIMPKEDIPKGIYRIKLTQKYNNRVLKEEYISFFVLDSNN